MTPTARTVRRAEVGPSSGPRTLSPPTPSDPPALTQQRLNTITAVTDTGVYVETERSQGQGTGPQLVDAWMLDLAWDMLQSRGSLTNHELLNVAHVHRSSAVCAILGTLPGVTIASRRPIRLELKPSGQTDARPT